MNMDVDGWNSTTKARKERRGVKDVQVDADLAAEEYGGNKNGRKNPQDSPGSKTITCSSIKSSNKVRIASYELWYLFDPRLKLSLPSCPQIVLPVKCLAQLLGKFHLFPQNLCCQMSPLTWCDSIVRRAPNAPFSPVPWAKCFNSNSL